MYEVIKPRLNDIEFFEEVGFHHSDKPIYEGKNWYIEGWFYVKDAITEEYNREKPFYERRKGNKGGDLGYVFPFLICNKGYAKKHGKRLESEGYKPIIMKDFSVELATDLIAKKIEEAGDNISLDELWTHLSLFADTEYDS